MKQARKKKILELGFPTTVVTRTRHSFQDIISKEDIRKEEDHLCKEEVLQVRGVHHEKEGNNFVIRCSNPIIQT